MIRAIFEIDHGVRIIIHNKQLKRQLTIDADAFPEMYAIDENMKPSPHEEVDTEDRGNALLAWVLNGDDWPKEGGDEG